MTLVNMGLTGLEYHGYPKDTDQYGDDIDNSISIRSSILIQNLSQIIKDPIVDKVLEWVQTT